MASQGMPADPAADVWFCNGLFALHAPFDRHLSRVPRRSSIEGRRSALQNVACRSRWRPRRSLVRRGSSTTPSTRALRGKRKDQCRYLGANIPVIRDRSRTRWPDPGGGRVAQSSFPSDTSANESVRGVLVLAQLIRRFRQFGDDVGEMALHDEGTFGHQVLVCARDLNPESIGAYPISMIEPASHHNDRASSQNR